MGPTTEPRCDFRPSGHESNEINLSLSLGQYHVKLTPEQTHHPTHPFHLLSINRNRR
jgi:hypothetical protein